MTNFYHINIKSFTFSEYVYFYELLNSKPIFFCSMYCRINGMEGQGTLYFVHINYEYCDVLNICHLGTQLSWKSCGTGSAGGHCNDQYQDRHWTGVCNLYPAAE